MARDGLFQKGDCYTRLQIRDMIGGGSVQDYMPSQDGVILCVCLSQEFDPSTQPVILVGAGPSVQKQADMFCTQNTGVPVFFKKTGNQWEYAGCFKPLHYTDDPQELVRFAESTGRINLTRVIYLRETVD